MKKKIISFVAVLLLSFTIIPVSLADSWTAMFFTIHNGSRSSYMKLFTGDVLYPVNYYPSSGSGNSVTFSFHTYEFQSAVFYMNFLNNNAFGPNEVYDFKFSFSAMQGSSNLASSASVSVSLAGSNSLASFKNGEFHSTVSTGASGVMDRLEIFVTFNSPAFNPPDLVLTLSDFFWSLGTIETQSPDDSAFIQARDEYEQSMQVIEGFIDQNSVNSVLNPSISPILSFVQSISFVSWCFNILWGSIPWINDVFLWVLLVGVFGMLLGLSFRLGRGLRSSWNSSKPIKGFRDSDD